VSAADLKRVARELDVGEMVHNSLISPRLATCMLVLCHS
jgi:hypothetical protein